MKDVVIRYLAMLIVYGALVAVVLTDAAGAETIPMEFNFAGYMRSGIGDNIKGGKQVCFNNAGSVANEFRLGNECSTYGEASFRAVMLKPQNPGDAFFRSQLTFAYFPPNDSQYEDTSIAGNSDINVVEAFVSGGNFGDFKGQIWAGKRFYRMVDIQMNDLYYFDNMNGTGAGVEKYKTPWGLLNIALLRESTFAETGLPPTGLSAPNKTRLDSASAGLLGKTALDIRYDMPVTTQTDISLWAAAAYSPPGSGTVVMPTPKTPASPAPPAANTYEAGRGYVLGIYTHQKFDDGGFNELSAAYGTGIMQVMEMGNGYGSKGPAGVVDGSGGNNATRLRLVESLTTHLTDRFSSQAAVTYENRYSGSNIDARSQWWNIGIRPYYSFSEHFSVLGEIGHSEVRDDSDRDLSGNPLGARQLTRLTLAPQFGIKAGIAIRPVIRFFVSHTFWNTANQSYKNGSDTKTISPTLAFANELSGTSVGFQSEVWF